MGNKHTMTDLYQMQSLLLSAKIKMTARRITEWVDRFGEEGVDDVVQAIKDLVSENPTDCFAQIVSDLDQIASDLKECEA